jgi:hypothetical protein
MRIACVGNCQLESLAWYIKYLLPNDECWWISFNNEMYGGYNFKFKFSKKSKKHKLFTKDFIDNVRCPYDNIDYIKSCDYVIYLKMLKNGSPNYYSEKLQTYFNNKCNSVSVTNYHIDINQYAKSLENLISRDQARGVDIGINKIISQHNKNEMTPKIKHEINHPPSNYFLKLLELICEHFDWQYFSKEDYEMFLQLGFPDGSHL